MKIVILFFLILFLIPGFPANAQEPIQISTETEDISLTDDINIARAQVSRYPDNPEAHFNLAIALSRTSRVEDAIKELRKTKLLIRKPENAGTIDKKINEYKEILNNNPNAEELNNIRYRLAFSHYLKAYLIAKNNVKNEGKKEKKENKTKDPAKLNLFSSKILSADDKDPSIKKNLDRSLTYFKDLLKINPKDAWAKVYYAFILAEQYNEINKAKELWIEITKDIPTNPAPYFFLGELHIKEGKLKEGILEISQALLLRSQGY